MDTQEAMSVIAGISYKEGCTLEVQPEYSNLYGSVNPFGLVSTVVPRGLSLTVKMLVPEARPQSDAGRYSMVTLCSVFSLPGRILASMKTPAELRAWVLGCLISAETHEAREFFKVDGELPFDPHDPAGDREWDTHHHWVRLPQAR